MARAKPEEFFYTKIPLLNVSFAFRWNREWGWTFSYEPPPNKKYWFRVTRRNGVTAFYLPFCCIFIGNPKA